MKKFLGIVVVLVLIGSMGLLAGPVENLYTLVIPQTYGYLALDGNLGNTALGSQANDVLQISMEFSPFAFSVDSGLEASYLYGAVTEDSLLYLQANGSLQVGTDGSVVALDETASDKQYGIELGDFPGFYAYGMDSQSTVVFSDGTVYRFAFQPYVALGVGRIYDIQSLKQAELLCRYLAIPVTEQNLRTAVAYLETREYRLMRYSEDNRLNYLRFYSEFADKLQVTDRMLSLVFISESQEFAFRQARYRDLKYGWEAQVAFQPTIVATNGSEEDYFEPAVVFSGVYADFFMDEKLHVQAYGSLETGYGFGSTDSFLFDSLLGCTARYLPDAYRWYFESSVYLYLSSNTSPAVELQLNGEANYLFSPNFTGYAGLSVLDTFGSIVLYAGGQYRIW
jgi:hypothetical protein